MRPGVLSGFVAVVVAAALISATPGVAAADPGGAPSANQVADAQAQAGARAKQVAKIQAQLAVADAQLQRVNAVAEMAVERYDKSQVDLTHAQQTSQVADLALSRANQRVAVMQAKIAQFARASYETGGLSAVGAFLSADGPATLLQGQATLNLLARDQHNALVEMQSARRAQHAAAYTARVALANQQKATAAVAHARDTATAALATAQTQFGALQHRQTVLQQALVAAEGRAAYLAHQRATYLARQAELAREAEQRRQAAQNASRGSSQGSSGGTTSSGSSSGSSGGSSYSGGVSRSTQQQASIAVQWAYKEIGKPYQWGASGPDTFDCSGLTMYVWGKAGIMLDHWTGYQWNEGAHVAQSDLRPGDLVFFAYNTSDPNTIHHVGLYVGNGMMIDAPQTGEFVREEPAFRDDYIGAVRP